MGTKEDGKEDHRTGVNVLSQDLHLLVHHRLRSLLVAVSRLQQFNVRAITEGTVFRVIHDSARQSSMLEDNSVFGFVHIARGRLDAVPFDL